MPREGVPYPERMLCSLKCELKNIWNALSGKLHSISGVEGDGQGNVDIVSGDAAVVVTPQPLSNQVEISLDQSQLPAAAVISVNGTTGAVVLDASDIDSGVMSPGNTVEDDITDLNTNVTANTGAIIAEATARGNADSTLQNNINSITASLPAAAAAAVAADPTIASLVAADSQNVKLSGNQSIGGIKTVSTEATGTYSSQIANSNKVKNELDAYAPMVRTTGNQSIAGEKTFTSKVTVDSQLLTQIFSGERIPTVRIQSDINVNNFGSGNYRTRGFGFVDTNGNELFSLYYANYNGVPKLMIRYRTANGTIANDVQLWSA